MVSGSKWTVCAASSWNSVLRDSQMTLQKRYIGEHLASEVAVVQSYWMLNDEYGCTTLLQYLLQQSVKVVIMKWALNVKHNGANCCFSKKERQVFSSKDWCIHTHASRPAIKNNPQLSFQHLQLVTQWLNTDINLKLDYLPRQVIHHPSLPYYL